MSYKIAIASSDEKQIDETFGSAKKFSIYEVDGNVCKKVEERVSVVVTENASNSPKNCAGGCGNASCSGQAENSAKVELISDCRCVVCKKIGFPIQKQLERKAISIFDVSCPVQEALDKITAYYRRIDNHEPIK